MTTPTTRPTPPTATPTPTATTPTARLVRALRRPRTIWSLLAVLATLVVGALGVGVWYACVLFQLFNGTLSVPCAEATRFAAAQPLPASARTAECHRGQWLGVQYTAEFHIPREDFEAWLRASYPTARPPFACEPTADLCVDVSMPADTTPPDAKGRVVRHLADGTVIEAWTVPDGTLRVELRAYTV
ncbi:hypothetical protein [Streptomyces sp. NPDC090022]|uniref:hypothetical protein n=1 Tax=Streptomyces sp. NPDC090022 TaxID=3365920 RepID=UPI003803E868